MAKKLTIEEAMKRCPDMLPGQKWRGSHKIYWFGCKKKPVPHKNYRQEYNVHLRIRGCPKCGLERTGDKNSFHRTTQFPGQKFVFVRSDGQTNEGILPALGESNSFATWRTKSSSRRKGSWTSKLFDRTYEMVRRGFSFEQADIMMSVAQCQYPGCLIGLTKLKMYSDHLHGHCDKRSGCPECYRGEICHGHNIRMGDIDAHPEWANEDDLEYMRRRPFARKSEDESRNLRQEVPSIPQASVAVFPVPPQAREVLAVDVRQMHEESEQKTARPKRKRALPTVPKANPVQNQMSFMFDKSEIKTPRKVRTAAAGGR
jgi:hypothetical protein